MVLEQGTPGLNCGEVSFLVFSLGRGRITQSQAGASCCRLRTAAALLFTRAELPVRANDRCRGAEQVPVRLTPPSRTGAQRGEQRPDAFPQREMKQERGHCWQSNGFQPSYKIDKP